jgi:membrane protein required for colicin V production
MLYLCMSIDIIFLLILLFAIFKGLQRGLIVAVFSVLALIIGLAAAIKLSVVVAVYLNNSVHVSAKWLPILSFILVFIAVILLVKWTASLLQAAIDFAWLGWINKLGGILLYAAVYTAIFSIILFYGTKSQVITSNTIAASKTYSFIEPWGPAVINGVGKIIPLFKNMFTQLEDFFNHLSQKLPK